MLTKSGSWESSAHYECLPEKSVKFSFASQISWNYNFSLKTPNFKLVLIFPIPNILGIENTYSKQIAHEIWKLGIISAIWIFDIFWKKCKISFAGQIWWKYTFSQTSQIWSLRWYFPSLIFWESQTLIQSKLLTKYGNWETSAQYEFLPLKKNCEISFAGQIWWKYTFSQKIPDLIKTS